MGNTKIGKRVRILREQYDWTLKELSQKAGISIGFLGDIESGRTNPSLNNLKKLAEVLKTTSDYLIGNSDEGNPEIQDLQGRSKEEIEFDEEWSEVANALRRSGKKMTLEDKKRMVRIIKAAIPADEED